MSQTTREHRSSSPFPQEHRVLVSACPFTVGQVTMLVLDFNSEEEAIAAVKAIGEFNEAEHPNYIQTAVYLG